MPVRSGSPAPYGPPAGVLDLILGYRDRGFATPFTPEVLLRAGISESLVPRVLKSMEGLDLIDKDGNPTMALEGLRRAKTDEFKARLEEVVRAAYAEVFQFADPSKDDATRIADAFRAYEPAGQRIRMVTLFMGLCAAAGIIPENAARKGASPLRNGKKPEVPRRGTSGPAAPKVRDPEGIAPVGDGLDPVLAGVLQRLPKAGEGWTQAARDHWLRFFTTNLDFVIPVVAEPHSATHNSDKPA